MGIIHVMKKLIKKGNLQFQKCHQDITFMKKSKEEIILTPDETLADSRRYYLKTTNEKKKEIILTPDVEYVNDSTKLKYLSDETKQTVYESATIILDNQLVHLDLV